MAGSADSVKETLAEPASLEQVIKNSRFLARAWPIGNIEEAEQQIAEIARQEASHHCWAWRLGSQYRFHDANEPAGTAGRPILAAIEGQNLDDVLVIVTRWFGGTKLGTGGLVRAYGGAAAECLRLAHRRTIIPQSSLRIWLSPNHQGPVRHLLQAAAAVRLEEGYVSAPPLPGLQLWIALRLPSANLDLLTQQLTDVTSGQIHWSLSNEAPDSTS
ncbi:MAG: YigZ family protein [Xanthomonadales bacterium]|nr:YigZ family protein [Xanthomonadales bacterium]